MFGLCLRGIGLEGFVAVGSLLAWVLRVVQERPTGFGGGVRRVMAECVKVVSVSFNGCAAPSL